MGTITIDDVEYQFDDLTDQQKAIVGQLSRCQQKWPSCSLSTTSYSRQILYTVNQLKGVA